MGADDAKDQAAMAAEVDRKEEANGEERGDAEGGGALVWPPHAEAGVTPLDPIPVAALARLGILPPPLLAPRPTPTRLVAEVEFKRCHTPRRRAAARSRPDAVARPPMATR